MMTALSLTLAAGCAWVFIITGSNLFLGLTMAWFLVAALYAQDAKR